MKTSVVLALAIAFIAGCNGDKGTGPDNTAELGQYLQGLPSWTEFSPPLPDQAAGPTGAAPTLAFDTVAAVTRIDTLGNTSTDSQVPYVCSMTPYSVQKTPQQIVMYSPNQGILYPGAFIQGRSYRDGIGSLLPLSITKRAPINVSIPAIQSADNYRTVDVVDQAHVASAVGSIIGNAVANNLQASSSMYWHMESYNSQSQFALSFAASGHYLGFEASVGGSIQTASSENTVVAHFFQKMFTVVVSPPSTPAEWFRSDFSAADFQQQVAAGNVGPNNLPVYIGEIVYGRMMMFSVTSSASMSDIQATISASYSGLIGGGSASLSMQQKTILQRAKIEMTSVGGNDSATIAMIRSGDWSQYFTVTAPLSTAEPLSYTFYNLATNTIAQVTEATSYNVKACAPASAGQFDFLPAQTFAAPVATPFEARLVDVNGDGRADLVYSHRDATGSTVAVALATADGSFAAPGAAVAAPGTANYALVTGDFNGDGKTDLAWSYAAGNYLTVYVGLANGSGGWTFPAPLQMNVSGGVFTGFKLYPGDVNGDGKTDLIFNQTSAGPNYVLTFLSNGDGTFPTDNLTIQTISTGGWTGYNTFVADVNRDGRADLIWNTVVGVGSGNRSYSAFSLGTGLFGALHGWYDHPVSCCWNWYQTLVADVNRDQVPDMLFYGGATASPGTFLSVALGTTSGPLSFLNRQELTAQVGPIPSVAVTGDVDGDGAADLIINSLTSSTNTVGVMRGTISGLMDLGVTPLQLSPVATNWNAALPAMSGDVNADGRADVVWVIPGAPTRLFVARSRAS